MATQDIIGFMNASARRHDKHASSVKMGYITAYNPNDYTVRVRLEPESGANEQAQIEDPVVETGWLPLFRTYGGNGWGEISPPNADPSPPYGDHCLVLFPDGGHGLAISGYYNNVERAYTERDVGLPGSNPEQQDTKDPTPLAGEKIFVHKNGQYVKLTNNGDIVLGSPPGAYGTGGDRQGASYVYVKHDANIEIWDGAGNFIKLLKLSDPNDVSVVMSSAALGGNKAEVTMFNDGTMIIANLGLGYSIFFDTDGSITVDSQSFITVNAQSEVTVNAQSTISLNGNGGTASNPDGGIVTRADLQTALDAVGAFFATKKDEGGSAGVFVAQSSQSAFTAE